MECLFTPPQRVHVCEPEACNFCPNQQVTVMQVSAYSSFGRLDRQRRRLDPASNEPLFTNCTRDFLGTLDYIFYTGIELTIQSITIIPTSLRSNTH